MDYAFAEVPSLIRYISRLQDTDPHRQEVLAYLCALFAELPYHHIPELEFETKKRAKIISSKAYREILANKVAGGVNVTHSLAGLRYEEGAEQEGFVIAESDGAIAIGFIFDRLLFIGFRGTIKTLFYDWKVNIKTEKVPISSYQRNFISKIRKIRPGKFHKGFADEARRISSEIIAKLSDRQIKDVEAIYLTGHSLGGAVAAISQEFIRFTETFVYTYGAPRYCDLDAKESHPFNVPIMYRREGDLVPTVPPLKWDYADPRVLYGLDGKAFPSEKEYFASSFIRWLKFAWGCAHSHDMEKYRADLGRTAKIANPDLPLIPHPKIKARHIK